MMMMVTADVTRHLSLCTCLVTQLRPNKHSMQAQILRLLITVGPPYCGVCVNALLTALQLSSLLPCPPFPCALIRCSSTQQRMSRSDCGAMSPSRLAPTPVHRVRPWMTTCVHVCAWLPAHSVGLRKALHSSNPDACNVARS